MVTYAWRVGLLVFWVASLGWLTLTKIHPGRRAEVRPTYRDVLPKQANREESIAWTIQWNEREVGSAGHRLYRQSDGTGTLDAVLYLHDLDLSDFVRRSLGSMGPFLAGVWNRRESLPTVQIGVRSRMAFDAFGQLYQLTSLVQVGGVRTAIELNGTVAGERFRFSVAAVERTDEEDEEERTTPIFQKTLEVPRDVFLIDALAPSPRLGRLKVGQRWTFQSVNSLLPTQAVQTFEAVVQRLESCLWDDRPVRAYVVAYRPVEGSTITAARRTVGRVWVLPDGIVIRQQMSLGSQLLSFHRLPSGEARYRDIDRKIAALGAGT